MPWTRYWPEGVKSKLPSGEKVSRRKKEVNLSALTYSNVLKPKPLKLGDVLGMTAGRGREGAGDAERRMAGDEPNDDRRLRDVGGGFIGKARLRGVPGAEGTGDPMA